MSNGKQATSAGEIGAWSMFVYRFWKWLRSPTPYRMLVGFALFFGAWFLLSEVFKFWRFASLPGPRQVLIEWFNPNPVYGMSLYTPDYYMHVWMSLRRVLIAFVIATGLGVPFGLFLGWSRNFREFTFPVFETLRPIPVLAWVPLAIVMFRADETPVIFLTTLASFYATALNTMLGVQSIDPSFPRAAACLGASKWQIFRHITMPALIPVSATIILIRLIEAFKIIDLPNVLTGGGPGLATESMTLHSFIAWRTQDLGGSAAVGYMLLFVSTVVCVSFFNFVVRPTRRHQA
jgi:NitT/TauT family transport system permease protein